MARSSQNCRNGRRSWQAGFVAAALAAATLAGCTSEERNEAGSGLIDVRFDALAETLTATVVADFGEVAVAEAAIPFPERQLLYVGRQGNIRSLLLARYDFAKFVQMAADSAGIPADQIVAARIKNADLFLYAVNYYRDFRKPDGTVVSKRYLVHELAEPLDASRFPGPPPALAAPILSATISPPTAPTPLPLPAAAIEAWAAAPQTFLGLAVGEDETQSDPGLIGFAAEGFPYPGSQLPDQGVGTLIGPVIRVQFDNDEFVNLLPEEDVSTLTEPQPIPASAEEGLLLQTHLRVYPRFWFDLAALPPNVLINYAGLVLTPDTLLSFGPSLELVVAEVDSAAVAGNAIELTALDDEVRIVTGRFGVEPDSTVGRIELDVTSTVQRFVNGAMESPAQFMLLAGEDFTGFDSGITDPEYTLSRLFFRGAGTPDPAERPRLRLVFTAVRQIRDGGGR